MATNLMGIFIPARTRLCVFILILQFYLPRVSAAIDGGDFSNNLFSDLGPILALFGEQVTKQFIAGSTTWEENLILSMVPLGIMTVLIGAIRIGAPVWLKAIVGRARENKAMAEVELTTSTSQDVCEMWDGSTIVRTMGSPSILQLVFLSKKKTDRELGLFTLMGKGSTFVEVPSSRGQEEKRSRVFKDPVLVGTFGNWIYKLFNHSKITGKDEEAGTDNRPAAFPKKALQDSDAPNVFLNLQPPKSPKQRWGLRLWAVFAVLLQAGVLIFWGSATYYPNMVMEHEEVSEVQYFAGYAYPLAAGGTLTLVGGMMICAYIVDGSTIEESWSLEDNLGKARILWLQKGGSINDQHFDSYAIFAKKERKGILTSRLTPYIQLAPQDGKDDKNGLNNNSPSEGEADLLEEDTADVILASKPIQTLVIIGAAMSVTGFIVQFTGLRAMHWSASIAQLIAIGIMAMVRAWIRRDLSLNPTTYKIPTDHELDWLAIRLSAAQEALWDRPRGGGTDPKSAKVMISDRKDSQSARVDGGYRNYNWKIVTGAGTKNLKLRLGMSLEFNSVGLSTPQHVMKTRERIGYVSGWTGRATEPAIAIANAIEIVMNTFFAEGEGEIFVWIVPVQTVGRAANSRGKSATSTQLTTNPEVDPKTEEGGTPTTSQIEDPEHKTISITIKRSTKSRRWKANSSEIEAMLSLWLYSSQKHRAEGPSPASPKPEALSVQDQDWLRQGKAALHKPTLRLLGPRTPCYYRDLQWYLGPKRMERIVQVEEMLDQSPLRFEHQVYQKFHTAAADSKEFESESEVQEVEASRVAGFREFSGIMGVGVFGNNFDHGPIQEPKAANLTAWFELPSDAAVDARSSPPINKASEGSAIGEKQGETKRRYLGIMSDASLEAFYAQDLLASFMWAVSERTKEIKLDGETHMIPDDRSNWQVVRVENSTLMTMINEIETVCGEVLGSSDELYPVLLPPLSFYRKLPNPSFLISYALNIARDQERVNHWRDATETYGWLLTQCERLDPGYHEDLKIRGSLAALEFRRVLQNGKRVNIGKDDDILEGCLESLDRYSKMSLISLDALPREVSNMLRWLYEAQNSIDLVNDRKLKLRYDTLSQEYSNLRQYGRDHMNILGPSGDVLDLLCDESTNPRRRRRRRRRDIFRSLREEKLKVSSEDCMGWTLLHYTTKFDIADYLPRSKIPKWVNSPNIVGKTPLHYAKSEAAAWALLQEGAQLDSQGRDGSTPLHCAIQADHLQTVQFLINAGANIDVLDNERRTPLHWAAYFGRESVVKLLVERGANIVARDRVGETPLHQAALTGKLNPSILECLVRGEQHLNISTRSGSTPLHHAAVNGQVEAAKLLVGAKAKIGARMIDGAQPIHLAVKGNSEELVRFLIQEGEADSVNSEGPEKCTPLHFTSDVAIAEMLVCEFGANVEAINEHQESPLHRACQHGHESIVKFLITKAKANVEAVDKDGNRPLHSASNRGHESIVKILVEKYGAALDICTGGGKTPLHLACRSGHEDVVRLLVEGYKVDVGAEMEDGKTPLHIACGNGKDVVARFLVMEGKANVDATDNEEGTPLHSCTRHLVHDDVAMPIAKILVLDGKANVNPVARRGSPRGTPLDFVQRYGIMPKLEEFLKQHGGKTAAELGIDLDAPDTDQ